MKNIDTSNSNARHATAADTVICAIWLAVAIILSHAITILYEFSK